MARNEEKSQSMLNRWLELQKEEAGVKKPQRRPHLVELCTNVSDGEKWRLQVIKEISKHVLHIQNESLEEHKIRDLNDHINKLMREKQHWEHRIAELGGPNHFSGPSVTEEAEESAIRAAGGYYYFGAAKNLPGVSELLKPRKQEEGKRTRYDMYQGIDADYYGYRDDDDGLLEELEAAKEKKLRQEALTDWDMNQISKGLNLPHPEVPSAKSHISHVELPSDVEIEQMLLKKRKEELMRKYF
uniref:Pre-mRNA-splicing factor ISY1 n=1 Tax=Arcella intermedia TaxID=1963864 RepID=A0A6B2LFM6_9EUKA|eukprot:TRINITY_DN1408_c0_g1_i1.p2 TRINITY_DN1408_c0_g1~~TRINITY_DN1408_c0_g1_i1.p2  ORF type:complete len:243 (-),score=67.59 TRINITY_DN1408_c0_g1_i1:851-1579(-)